MQLTISRGNLFAMPNLNGQTPDQARTALQRAGWNNGTLTQTTRGVPLGSPDDGKVLSQEPAAGSKVRKTDSVSITIGRASLLPG